MVKSGQIQVFEMERIQGLPTNSFAAADVVRDFRHRVERNAIAF
jgi:hypothetical protein